MQASAHSGVIVPVGKLPHVDLIYHPPLGDWKAFEAALISMASRFVGRIRLVRADSAKLCQLTRARVFLSKTVPNIIVLRGGEVVAHVVGALPMAELKGILEGATKCAA
jgi:thioredoxin-like negative regulator of GroEL